MTRHLTWLLPLLIWGCSTPSDDEPETVLLDLAADLDQADILSEREFLDIGTPEARAFLTRGWSWNEKGKGGTTFVWGFRHSSDLDFFLAGERPLELHFRCIPYRQTDGSIDGVAISVNGKPVDEVALQRGWQEYELVISADSLRAGVNRLAFHYLWTTGEAGTGQDNDKRQVGVAWDWIRFPGLGAEQPTGDVESGVLELTPGSRVDFFFAATADAELVIDSVEQIDEGELEISTLTDSDRGPRLLAIPDAGLSDHQPLRWHLGAESGLVRLRLQSRGRYEVSRPRVFVSERAATTPDALATRPLSVPRTDPPLILLYLIDTLRADHLSISDYLRETTPGLSSLVTNAVVFEDAIAQSSWTKPTVASLLTGHLPWMHGAQDVQDALSGAFTPLAAHLQDAGFRTGAFSANGYVSETFGFDHGFDHFALMAGFDAPSGQVQAEALRWLAGQDDASGVFLYIHTIDPHAPYDPADPFRASFADDGIEPDVGTIGFMRALAHEKQPPKPTTIENLIDLYDAEIAANDQQLAEMIEALKSQNLYDSSLIIVVSDHGEEFFDHGSWTHGRTLHREVLNVPLVIKFPNSWGAGGRVRDTVQQIDLLPTLLDYLELSQPDELPGQSLLCAIQQSIADAYLSCGTSEPRPVFASVHYHHNHQVGVVLGDWKLLIRGISGLNRQARLFNRRQDPDELDNLADQYPVRVGYLTTLIRREMQRRPQEVGSEQVELDEETAERLEALGYLN